ncbi:hypothetical protein L207DRAFT_285819 [Hyaloscypha variabilis F]|uniref:Uncharacterized protein n=1 Tax=Hyaloscypha variabilis (strain UAMH 11265 / GT02V1 / F) TaxID=1149755 RepID=A0A2J6S1W0_HYAVF|nr:hypothetical protein L207DRAFT_285819 [Hyaloscypha variabilis F]
MGHGSFCVACAAELAVKCACVRCKRGAAKRLSKLPRHPAPSTQIQRLCKAAKCLISQLQRPDGQDLQSLQRP